MLRSDHHIGCSVQRIRSRRVDPKSVRVGRFREYLWVGTDWVVSWFGCASDTEINFGTGTSADPVRLKFFDTRGPIQSVQVVQEPITVGCDFQHPLSQRHALYGVVASFAFPVDDFFIGQYGS